MMYAKLLKVFFKENFSLRRILGTDPKKNKGKTILFIILLLYGLGAFAFSFGFMFFDLGKLLQQIGSIDVLLIYGFIYTTMLGIMFVLFRANGYLFNYKDYEILEPLPIKSRTVVFAKLTVMLVFIYASLFLFLAPILFSYFYHGGFDVVSLIFVLFAALTIPLIPTIVFSFVSLLVARITARFRRTNILNIILLFVVFLGIMYLSLSVNTLENANPLLNQQGFMEKVGGAYPPIKWFVEAVAEKNIVSLILLLTSNGLLFTGFIFAVQTLVRSTNQRGLSKVTRKNNKAAISVRKSPIQSIVAKETRTFFNTPIYAFNSGFGPLMLIILSIASIFYADNILGYFNNELNLGVGPEIIILILFGFCLSMLYTSAISLSLEGKNFWIIKSLPIKPKTVMFGKMLFNIYLGLPIAIASLMLFAITLKLEMLLVLAMMFFIISMSLVVSAFGSIVNLFMPKFEFRNPAEVVKQSAAAMLGLFGSWIILVVDGLIFYFVTKSMSSEIALVLMSLVNYVLFAAMVLFIDRKTESLFIKFEV